MNTDNIVQFLVIFIAELDDNNISNAVPKMS